MFLFPFARGTEEYYGIEGRVDIINSTLGKALGGAAGKSDAIISTMYTYLLIIRRHLENHCP